jgi:RNA polymerase sigma-70 factor (ECF subfamily)
MTFSTNPESSTDASQSEDSARLDSSKQGVPNALFIEIVKKNYQMYLRKCYAYVKCSSIAEDAVQEGILAAHVNLASVKNLDALASWVYRIIVRKAIDLLHKKRRLVLLGDEFDELVSYNKHGFLDAPLWAETLNPEEKILKNESLKQVSIAVESLDDIYRIPLLLKDFEEFSILEISEMLQISESNTKIRIHRARIKLKSELNEYFFPSYSGRSV